MRAPSNVPPRFGGGDPRMNHTGRPRSGAVSERVDLAGPEPDRLRGGVAVRKDFDKLN